MQKKALANRIKELRKAHGYMQVDVAAALNVVQQTYSHYETGRRTPDPDTLYKLAAFYQINVDDLMRLAIDEAELADIYESPVATRSADDLTDFLSFFNSPTNQKKYKHLSNTEKELIYCFTKLKGGDQRELIEFAKLKVRLYDS